MAHINPILDPHFEPLIDFYEVFKRDVLFDSRKSPFALALCTPTHCVARMDGFLFFDLEERNFTYIERMIRTFLWLKGGIRIHFFGPESLSQRLKEYYNTHPYGIFDRDFMTEIYGIPFEIISSHFESVPVEVRQQIPIASSLNGARIGFDAGGSDMKICAVLDGEVYFHEEIVWLPKVNADSQYHVRHIKQAIQKAVNVLPRVDALGVSSAGIYIDNLVRVASLFRQVPKQAFIDDIQPLFVNIAKDLGVPVVVANDGDVSALAGAQEIGKNNVLGLAFGTSEAAGYIDASGCLTGWLNELAFVPVSIHPRSPHDEWSNDLGSGSCYFSQDAVIRLAKDNHLPIDVSDTLANQLKAVQKLLREGHPIAKQIFQTIGVYFAYGLRLYYRFYQMDHVLVLGRVVSGEGGQILLDSMQEALQAMDPLLHKRLQVRLPNEETRRFGQAITAASLPKI